MATQPMSLLLIDDRKRYIKKIQRNLLRYLPDCQLSAADNLWDAMNAFRQHKVNAVLLNLSTPQAQDILKEMRTLEVPVIGITDKMNADAIEQARETGASDCLRPDELSSTAMTRTIQFAIEKKTLEQRMGETISKLSVLAIRDGLTNLYNHRHLHEVMEIEFRRARRHKQPLAGIMVDLDYFKTVNDTYGHQFGDFVLREASGVLNEIIRFTDIAARYGGDEFFLLLPHTRIEGAAILGEKIRSRFSSHVFNNGAAVSLTVSIGVAALQGDMKTKDDLLRRTDEALYMAKRQGRNMVCCWEKQRPELKIPAQCPDEMMVE
jgi:diguanylate cyclase (GGDEF)-like protein